MAKEKTYVKVDSHESDNGEVYGKDEHGKIIKIEQKWNPQKRWNKFRLFAVLCWLIAIVFEIIWILRLTEVISRFSGLELTTFLLIALWLDLLFFVPGSLLWKKANHIDPASEKNKTKFLLWNNLGSILSVLAFLPIIIFVLTDKKLDKKSKTLVTSVAAIALVIAWLTGYDFNPVSSEQLERAEQEVLQVSPSGTVYWAEYSKKYHVDKDCPAFSNSETVYEGTVRDAYERNLTEPCRRCIPEYKWDEIVHEHEENIDEAEDTWELGNKEHIEE